ncbi:MAG: amidohydrolase [Pseudomonadales bacterium]|nr:amidohydrolase [Pseudomonadales bacterium]NIX07990.1 amidohydrolase [Pseudomonadales bacterium]
MKVAGRCVLLGLAVVSMAAAADPILERVDAEGPAAVSMAERLWALAELGYQETRSAELLSDYLVGSGFAVESGVAGIPTAFVASFGSGSPTIGVLAEFDALPGMSQAAEPSRRPLEPEGAGHACGHHLFGAGAAAAAVAAARWMEANGLPGTIRVFGTPAEEGGSGKVYLTRAGVFDDVDVVLHWHPGSRNDASPASTTANKSGRFTFRGVAAHAAAAPERGRSALDGVEAMNYMVNLMREHVPPDSRIHYVITKGGDAPNIVPETAQVYYYVRHPQVATVAELFERVVAAARGAALGTGTSVDYEVMHGNYPVLPNETLARRVHAHLVGLGGISYSADERRFAEQIQATLGESLPPLSRAERVEPFQVRQNMGSTDVGDVSWKVPTVGFYAATWVPGTPAHSWQAVAAGGTSIGHKGMLLAARTLALTAADLLRNPSLIEAARAELERRQGPDFRYSALLGDRDPPLDYRR